MSAQLDVQIHHQAQALVIPFSAVTSADGQQWVWRVDQPGQQASRVPVVTGHTLVDGIEITSGLNPGDVILTAAQVSLQPADLSASGSR